MTEKVEFNHLTVGTIFEMYMWKNHYFAPDILAQEELKFHNLEIQSQTVFSEKCVFSDIYHSIPDSIPHSSIYHSIPQLLLPQTPKCYFSF